MKRRASLCTILPWLTLAMVMGAGCREASEDVLPTRSVSEVLAQHTPALMAIPGVVGTYESALADGTPCIKVMVVERTRAIEERIPDRLEGHPVVIEETGEIRAMPDSAP